MDAMQSDRQRLVSELLQARHDFAAAQARFEALLEALASRVQTCFSDATHIQRQGAPTPVAIQRTAPPPRAAVEAPEAPVAPAPLLPTPLPSEESQSAAVGSALARLPATPLPALCTMGACSERCVPSADAGLQDAPPPRISGATSIATASAVEPPVAAAALLTARLPPRTPTTALGSGAASLAGLPSLLSPSRCGHRAPPPLDRGMAALKPPLPPYREEEEMSAADSDEAESSGCLSEQPGERPGRESPKPSGRGDSLVDEGESEEASEEEQDAELDLDDEDDLKDDDDFEEEDDFEEDEEEEANESVEVQAPRPGQRLMSMDDLEVEERPRQKLMSLDDLASD